MQSYFTDSTFWSNTVWYILLGVATVIQLILIFTRTKNPYATFALYCTISGIVFTYEATICMILKSYDYFPMIIRHSPLDDTLAGNLFSQFFVSATALLIAVYNLNYYWNIIFALVISIIEELFLSLGIYSQNWYQTWMTFVGLQVFFLIVKRIYEQNFKELNQLWRCIYIFFGLFTLHVITIFWVSKLTGILIPNMEFLSDEFWSYTLAALSNLIVLSIVCMLIYYWNGKSLWKLLLFTSLYIAIYFACEINLISIKKGWFFPYTTINIFSMYLYVVLLNKLYVSKTDS